MENEKRDGPLASQVGAKVRKVRTDRGWRLADLAERVRELGSPLSLNAISKIEIGKRNVDLDDIAALARALGVPPVVLMFPLGEDETVEVLPGVTTGTWAAVKWFTGEAPFPSQLPDGRWAVADSDAGDWRDAVSTYFREQDELLDEWNTSMGQAGTARKAADRADTDDERVARLQEAEAHSRLARRVETHLRRHRAAMRAAGLVPSELTPNLAHLDEQEVSSGR